MLQMQAEGWRAQWSVAMQVKPNPNPNPNPNPP